MDRDLERYLRQARRTAAHREAGSEREIRGLYREMLKELQDFMGETYAQYAQEDRLTYGMLQAAGYEARFLEEVEQRLNLAAPKAAEALRKLVEQTYEAAYTAMAQGVQRAAQGMDAGFPASIAITPEQIKAAVENPVSGLTLKDTLEKNRKEIVYEIKKAVGVGLMNGDRYTTMARRIAQQLDGDYKKAVRIARTEAGRVREAGSLAAAQSADRELRAGQSGLRLTKTWKTMKDEKVRPQRRRKGKGGWSSRMGHGANHMILEGQTVLADQEFDLMDGHTAPAPLNSGIAGHDINCRCYAAYELMTDAEYFERTGEHFPEAGGLTGEEGQAGALKDEAGRGIIDPSQAPAFRGPRGQGIRADYRRKLEAMYNQGTWDAKRAYRKYVPEGGGILDGQHLPEHEAWYSRSDGQITINFEYDNGFSEGAGRGWFHEHGHMVDHKAGDISQSRRFEEALRQDYRDAVDWTLAVNGWKRGQEALAYKALNKEIWALPDSVQFVLSDLFSGLSGDKIRASWRHGSDYWQPRGALAQEAFAHFYYASFDRKVRKQVKKYMPNAWKVFEQLLKGAV